jgi:hypothetical protein
MDGLVGGMGVMDEDERRVQRQDGWTKSEMLLEASPQFTVRAQRTEAKQRAIKNKVCSLEHPLQKMGFLALRQENK